MFGVFMSGDKLMDCFMCSIYFFIISSSRVSVWADLIMRVIFSVLNDCC